MFEDPDEQYRTGLSLASAPITPCNLNGSICTIIKHGSPDFPGVVLLRKTSRIISKSLESLKISPYRSSEEREDRETRISGHVKSSSKSSVLYS